MMATREELKALFDTQINRMLVLIDQQFDRMQTKFPRTQIVGCHEPAHHSPLTGHRVTWFSLAGLEARPMSDNG